MKGDRKEIPEAVKRWVEHYESNQNSAMAKLLTMLFQVIIIARFHHFANALSLSLSHAGLWSKIQYSGKGY